MHDGIWLKRVLVPFWVFDLGMLLVVLTFASMVVSEGYRENNVVEVVLVVMSAISIIFDVTTIILFAKHKLAIPTYLIFQCIKTVFWSYKLGSDIQSAVRDRYTSFYLLFSTVLFCTSVGQLAYGSVTLSHKKRGKLPRQSQYSSVGYETPPRGSYAAYNPHGAPPNPFRDPSPRRRFSLTPSADAAQPNAGLPEVRLDGEATEYYDPSTVANHSYEMQGTTYRDL